MTPFEILSSVIAGLSLYISWKSYKKSKANSVEIEKQKIEIGKLEISTKNNIKFVQEQIKSVAKIHTGDIGGGWAGGVNHNCTSIGNKVEIHQNQAPSHSPDTNRD